jgi:hypothetical protein
VLSSFSYAESAVALQAGNIKVGCVLVIFLVYLTSLFFSLMLQGCITFSPSSFCQSTAPAILLLQVGLQPHHSQLLHGRYNAQGVRETLKSAGKDAYILRFSTEQQAQEWQRAFELIAKV